MFLISDGDREYSWRDCKGSFFSRIGLEVESFEGFNAAR